MNNIKDVRIKTYMDYKKAYQESVQKPDFFWDRIASKFYWHQKWSKTFEYDFDKAEFKWFLDGKLNITENLLDQQLVTLSLIHI